MRTLVLPLVVAAVLLAGCGATAQQASNPVASPHAALTNASTCTAWAEASSEQQTAYAQVAQPYIAVPYQYRESAVPYVSGAIAGRCHRAAVAGTAGTTILASLLDRPLITPASASVRTYPMVHFSVTSGAPVGSWPFTAQLVGISTNPAGFGGSPPVPPQYTYLTVQVNITSLITDRPVQPPGVTVDCHAPGDGSWVLNSTQVGYDEGSEPPSPSGYNVPMNDGQPHPWDVEWRVPMGTSVTNVRCVLLSEKGSLKLN